LYDRANASIHVVLAKVGSPWRQFRLWWFEISCRMGEPDEKVFHIDTKGWE